MRGNWKLNLKNSNPTDLSGDMQENISNLIKEGYTSGYLNNYFLVY